MFEIIICDDDSACLEQTNQFVTDWSDRISTPVSVKAMDNEDALIEYCKKTKPQVILLDIMMPFLNGMDVAREIRKYDSTTKIVFLTTSPEFAIESYDVDASGYILKPVDRQKLYNILDKCLNESARPVESITLHTNAGFKNILLGNIECLEAQNKKVLITLFDADKIETTSTLSYYEKILTLDKGFFKCHRSYIVYMPAVDHFDSSEIVTRSGMKLPIARGQGKTFQDAYFSYMFQN